MNETLTALDRIAAATWTVYVLAGLVGLVMSLLFTQWLKLLFPRRWRKVQRKALTIVAAFIVAGVPPFVLLTWYSHWVPGLIVGLVAGGAAPFTYDPVAALVGRKWPWFAKSLDSAEEP